MKNEDVETLLHDIFSRITCSQDFEMIYIFKGKRSVDLFSAYHPALNENDIVESKKWAFGYWDTNTPKTIEELGIGKIVYDAWWVRVYESCRESIQEFLSQKSTILTIDLAHNKIEQRGIIIADSDVGWNKKLPQHRKTIRIDTNMLKAWVNQKSKLDNGLPCFNRVSGELSYGGQSVNFRPHSKEAVSIELLINNLNSLVSKQCFYEVCGDKYPDIRNTRIAEIHQILEDRFKSIKHKIRGNSLFKKKLIFVQQDGFGIFENKNPAF